MTGIYDHAISSLDHPQWTDTWALTLRRCVRQGGGNFCKLWETLGPEIGLSEGESQFRGVALYYWFCTLNLVDDIMDGDCDYVSKLDQPLAVLGMCNEVHRALAGTVLSHSALFASLTCMRLCIDGQHRETRGCESLDEYIKIGDRIAGDQFAAYFAVFADGTTFQEDGHICGRMYGRACHVLKDFGDKDSRLLECGDVPGVVAWALNGLDQATVRVLPPSMASKIETVRAMLQALDERAQRA